MQTFVSRLRPNRPHISSDIINFKEPRDKNDGSAFLFWRARRSTISVFVAARVFRPAGEGVSTDSRMHSQGLFSKNLHFFSSSANAPKI